MFWLGPHVRMTLPFREEGKSILEWSLPTTGNYPPASPNLSKVSPSLLDKHCPKLPLPQSYP